MPDVVEARTETLLLPYTASSAVVAPQQPEWSNHPDLLETLDALHTAPSLVEADEIEELRSGMVEVQAGRQQILQLGDCAETLESAGGGRTQAKLDLLEELAATMERAVSRPVLRIGRLGGQFAKPRSKSFERCGSHDLPVFRGEMVNRPEPTSSARVHDPRRMLLAFDASARVLEQVRFARRSAEGCGLYSGSAGGRGPWTSHEALVLDYEYPQVRTVGRRTYLSSTHFPWVGERTRSPYGAHVDLLSGVANPVACKIGPSADPRDVVELCQRINPEREAGRLTLIARMGRESISDVLPRIIEAVAAAGHAPVWVCDPMHGNTIVRQERKTRLVEDIVAEVSSFRDVLKASGLPAGGLHLEVANSAVTECIGHGVADADLARRYTSQCDPRLNPAQAYRVLKAWSQ